MLEERGLDLERLGMQLFGTQCFTMEEDRTTVLPQSSGLTMVPKEFRGGLYLLRSSNLNQITHADNTMKLTYDLLAKDQLFFCKFQNRWFEAKVIRRYLLD
jgi:hypothetical protein